MPGTQGLRYPKCSRQGHVLASTGATTLEFKILRAGEDAWGNLGPLPLAYPGWKRDGTAFCGWNAPELSIDCYAIDRRQLERLTQVPFPLASWEGVPWIGLDASDNPFVAADRSTAALYALEWETP
jgi:hypothetical protein